MWAIGVIDLLSSLPDPPNKTPCHNVEARRASNLKALIGLVSTVLPFSGLGFRGLGV